MTQYRIGEVAEHSGFAPPTLRYYEQLGLVQPSRTGSGYRTYDESALERLAFIARAKQLGCSLDEIAELLPAWDGGQCTPVQDRLRSLVGAKLTQAHTQIAELQRFVSDLERAAVSLEQPQPDGPCHDQCGCVSDVAPLLLARRLR